MKRSKLLVFSCVILAFLAISCLFVPDQVFKGKTVDASDYTAYIGMSREAQSWDNTHPDNKTAWTGSMFSGMPTMMITGNVQGDHTRPLFNFLNKKKYKPAGVFFLSMIGAFLLLLVLGISPVIAAIGAFAVSFCSYNPQIIQVGHNTKMLAIAYAPWVLAAMIFTYKKAFYDPGGGWKKWLPATILGAALFGLALAFQIKSNHIQITWYLALIIVVYVIGLIVWLCLGKDRFKKLWVRFTVASLALLVTGVAGIGTNACELVPMQEFTKQTIRGGSELSDGPKDGISLEYATAWSYGWNELPNLMIPNFNGGASLGPLPNNSKTATLLKKSNRQNYRKDIKNQPMYWGSQPSTAGPMYIGAITVFLFLLGLMVCEGKDRWWMLVAALLSIGLALGDNLMPLTRFFHDKVPFYNKFRAVSMSLVMLQLIMPMLAFLALDRVLKGDVKKKDFLVKGLIAFGLTGGICLIFSLFPGLAGDFKSSIDSSLSEQYSSALAADRKTLLRNDAFISFLCIGLTYLLLLWTYKENAGAKVKALATAGICLLVVINLFSVDKRYLNSSHFKTKKDYSSNHLVPRTVDKRLMEEDKSTYRIADLTENVFSSAKPSLYHKNIGGYNAAKLRRYDDLINHYLTKEIDHTKDVIASSLTFGDFVKNLDSIPVLNMLNTKYFIYNDELPLQNPYAMGNAWLVESGVYTSTPDEEIAALGKTDLHTTAILGPDFKNVKIPENNGEDDGIALIYYSPNEVRYVYRADKPRAAVFSEIYYPIGWTATVDKDIPVNIFRANWTLRGAILPAGRHVLVMKMDPPSYKKGARLSSISSILLYAFLAIAAAGMLVFRKKNG